MKKISKTISIIVLLMMIIGLVPNVSFAKAPEAIHISLTAEEMECIVGGSLKDDKKNPGDKGKENPPSNGKEGDKKPDPEWEEGPQGHHLEYGKKGHVDGITNTSYVNPYTVNGQKALTTRWSLQVTGSAEIKSFYKIEATAEYEKTKTVSHSYILHAEPRERFDLFYEEVISVNTYTAYKVTTGVKGKKILTPHTATIRDCSSIMYCPEWKSLD